MGKRLTTCPVALHIQMHDSYLQQTLVNFPSGRILVYMGNQPRWSKAISTRVRRAIKSSGLSDHRVATLTGIPKTTFDRRLDGNHPWNTDELVKVAKVLDCHPSEFIPASMAREAKAS